MPQFDDDSPIFQQVAERIENDILTGALAEESQVPSTNEFAAYYRINPATAGKGINQLVDRGVLYKRRGIGMFVAAGARDRLSEDRREKFRSGFLTPLIVEARVLGITDSELIDLIAKEGSTP